jgi:uncharacterized protein YcbK (DUF882 family)
LLRSALKKSLCVRIGLAFAVLAAGLSVATLFSAALTDAQARERDRTLKIKFTHTGEKGEFTFKRNGRYDRAVLDKLNAILRDWRRNEPTRMDPLLFDLIWEIYQKTGSREYIHVVSGYRSLTTNNMLRKRSRGVAKRSRHTQGKAMDFFIPGVSVSKIRKIGLKMQDGGVGYYPSSRSPFVHIDTGSVRHWPRMTRRQLASVFPNGGTLHLPSDGKPLPGYERALARAGKSVGNTTVAYLDAKTRSIRPKDDTREKATLGKWLKKVFAGGADEEEDNSLAAAGSAPADRRPTPPEAETAVAAASPGTVDELPPAPLPRTVPSRTRLILVAAAERSQTAAADELAMVALVSASQTPPARPRDNAGDRFEFADRADDAIAAPDRSALASLYLAAARRAAALAPGKATTEPVLTAALPAQRPPAPAHAATSPFVLAAAIPAPSQASFSLASAGQPIPAAAPLRTASYSPVAMPPVAIPAVAIPPVAIPRSAPPASAAAGAPGSAIAAANALGLMGTLAPQRNKRAKTIKLAYASASATRTSDGRAAKAPPGQKAAAANSARPARAGNGGSAPAYPAVTLNAHLTTAAPSANGLRRFMSQTTTRTRAFARLERPRPDRVPGFYIAPRTAAEAILPTAVKPPRTDRFAIDGNQLRLRFIPPRLAGLY